MGLAPVGFFTHEVLLSYLYPSAKVLAVWLALYFLDRKKLLNLPKLMIWVGFLWCLIYFPVMNYKSMWLFGWSFWPEGFWVPLPEGGSPLFAESASKFEGLVMFFNCLEQISSWLFWFLSGVWLLMIHRYMLTASQRSLRFLLWIPLINFFVAFVAIWRFARGSFFSKTVLIGRFVSVAALLYLLVFAPVVYLCFRINTFNWITNLVFPPPPADSLLDISWDGSSVLFSDIMIPLQPLLLFVAGATTILLSLALNSRIKQRVTELNEEPRYKIGSDHEVD